MGSMQEVSGWYFHPMHCVETGCTKEAVMHWAVYVMKPILFAVYNANQTMEPRVESTNIGNLSLQITDKLCYLGDIIRIGGGSEPSSIP